MAFSGALLGGVGGGRTYVSVSGGVRNRRPSAMSVEDLDTAVDEGARYLKMIDDNDVLHM